MSEALTTHGDSTALVIDRGLQTSDVVARARKVQEIMSSLMQENVHYGKVPGTQKPSLWKAGAELLLMTFRVGTRLEVEDLSTHDTVRYRVKVFGFNQHTGDTLGEAVGEASSSEERWRWRATVHEKEWHATDADHRRIKYDRSGGETRQVRTSPADLANTILMMATKRGMVAMTRTVTACSDIFDQDIEDLQEGDDKVTPTPPQVQRASATGKKPATAPAGLVTDARTVKDVRVFGKDKNNYALTLDGDPNEYTTKDAKIATELEGFKGTDHKIRVRYEDNPYQGKTYHNIKSFAIADPGGDLTAGDIPF